MKTWKDGTMAPGQEAIQCQSNSWNFARYHNVEGFFVLQALTYPSLSSTFNEVSLGVIHKDICAIWRLCDGAVCEDEAWTMMNFFLRIFML